MNQQKEGLMRRFVFALAIALLPSIALAHGHSGGRGGSHGSGGGGHMSGGSSASHMSGSRSPSHLSGSAINSRAAVGTAPIGSWSGSRWNGASWNHNAFRHGRFVHRHHNRFFFAAPYRYGRSNALFA